MKRRSRFPVQRERPNDGPTAARARDDPKTALTARTNPDLKSEVAQYVQFARPMDVRRLGSRFSTAPGHDRSGLLANEGALDVKRMGIEVDALRPACRAMRGLDRAETRRVAQAAKRRVSETGPDIELLPLRVRDRKLQRAVVQRDDLGDSWVH